MGEFWGNLGVQGLYGGIMSFSDSVIFWGFSFSWGLRILALGFRVEGFYGILGFWKYRGF